MKVILEGSYGSHIQRRDQEGSLRGNEYGNKEILSILRPQGIDILNDLSGCVGGKSVHNQEGRPLDVVGDKSDVFFHARNVHPVYRFFMPIASAARGPGGIAIGVLDEEWGNVNTIAANGQGNRVAKGVTLFLDDSIAPILVSIHANFE